MKAREIMEELYGRSSYKGETVDTCKIGDLEVEVSRIAVTMFATPEVIRDARDWGAQLLIVHEPLFYNHEDRHSREQIETEKRIMLVSSEMAVYRYHDHAHATRPDTICAGMVKAMGLPGSARYTSDLSKVYIRLRQPMTPRQLAYILEKSLGLSHIRIAGAADAYCTQICGMFGTPPGVFEELKKDDCEIVLTGETCEWSVAEYVRDAAQLGYRKALLVLGHEGSERDGMRLTAAQLAETYPQIEVRYFECEEVYSYTDS